mmetsp:Transcript_29330/g.66082  ORF Transcript_29330/g.66082 Transcript_29330/m.66082 type:complete len:119 (+) Transcript_29330:94-450(+)
MDVSEVHTWPVSWAPWLARLLSPTKEGRIRHLGQLVVVTVLGLAVSVLVWGRPADQHLADDRPHSAPDQQGSSRGCTAQEAKDQASAEPGGWRTDSGGEDDLFFDILDAYAAVRQHSP